MTKAKKLIEVALPIREVSIESKRDKDASNAGHISTLHQWWARRPLPVCRAVVFASLVPDPIDPACPPAFVEAINILLKNKVYQPYEDIPFTAVADKMEDNPRNRLLCFIGKFSDEFVTAEKNGSKLPSSKKKLSAHSLIKWESKNDERILTIARKLIYVAHNAEQHHGADAGAMLWDYEQGYAAVKAAEKALYETTDRHLGGAGIQSLEAELATTIEAYLDRMPKVFDPFAGGGAIPLEAARLGCRSYGNDINPVAHIIQRASLEFSQRFGKAITFSQEEYSRIYGREALKEWQQANGKFPTITLPNRLSHDVEHYAKYLLAQVKKRRNHLYPKGNDDREVIAYYWARTAKCSNPACNAEVPLIRTLNIAKTNRNKIYLRPVISGNRIDFSIEEGTSNEPGYIDRGNLSCPCCNNITPNVLVKEQFWNGNASERLMAVIYANNGPGKSYELPTKRQLEIVSNTAPYISTGNRMSTKYTKALALCLWGIEEWEQMFSFRQLSTVNTFVEELAKLKLEWSLNEVEPTPYYKALATYLSIWIDRIIVMNTMFGRWHVTGEKLEHPFSRQAIAMVFDYPESNPFCSVTGSAINQLKWVTKYIDSEGIFFNYTISKNASSGEVGQFPLKSISSTVTDPPYYDAIAYADLSDFFYSWLKKMVGDIYPENFATPQTPKSQECTALKHHHKNNDGVARQHFEHKLQEIFAAIEKQTDGVISVMFAHQTPEAWSTLCNSVLNSNMNITGSWAIDTEMSSRSVGLAGASLKSSVTVSCSPTQKEGYGDYQEVQALVEQKITETVRDLYALGFRGADLLTACFGQAVSVFGRYKAVEKANGDEVTVAELLDLAKDAAFKAIISDIRTDELTKFYIGWLNLNQFSEEDHDMVRKVTQIGLNIDTSLLQTRTILVGDGNKQRLASSAQRYAADEKIGTRTEDAHIDQVHRLMQLWQLGNRGIMLEYIQQVAGTSEHAFWRVMNSLKELLPPKHADAELVNGLLSSQEDLLREAKTFSERYGTQGELRL